ncbi:uncharacterized protein BT62DRAFT_1002256 [Guyanagaster necrorhizus]|uniref:Uncharacterized protein n=1 Tax=Guyanagaster necrorhizus TaxID=856835 RepID=A0A9P8AVV5_9AGAR|nr:uncharacterized protein BT62DRAFT_1002256 [Guyanagaster necrorhizus MCA 3950]KAG7449928.1 hypothetical protein BT62DRAFT_1002256 [Guyanagaster necrorhizus MCA 3950]
MYNAAEASQLVYLNKCEPYRVLLLLVLASPWGIKAERWPHDWSMTRMRARVEETKQVMRSLASYFPTTRDQRAMSLLRSKRVFFSYSPEIWQ